MIRYRIDKDPGGRQIVLPAWLGIVPMEETYASRQAAQETADWLNCLADGFRQQNVQEVRSVG
jgi:hypothetical protein